MQKLVDLFIFMCYNVDVNWRKTMRTNEFIYLFDLLDFDRHGNVCATKFMDLKHAQSNFLYLISKYNQMFLKEQDIDLPAFFKEDLADVLIDLETEEKTFEQAKALVLNHCLPQVQKFATENEKSLFLNLRDKVGFATLSVSDKSVKKMVDNFETCVNNKEKGNRITRKAGEKFNNICQVIANHLLDKEFDKNEKSFLFKEVIAYNSLVKEAVKTDSKEEERLIG